MKKIIKFIRSNILGLLVGLSLCLNGVIIAENMITSEQVSYSNDKTSETTVKGNLDELFSAVDINERLGNNDISTIGDGTVTGGINQLKNNLGEMQLIKIVNAEPVSVTVPANGYTDIITLSVEAVDGAAGYLYSVDPSIPYCYWTITSGTGSNWVKGRLYNPTSIDRSGTIYSHAIAYKFI